MLLSLRSFSTPLVWLPYKVPIVGNPTFLACLQVYRLCGRLGESVEVIGGRLPSVALPVASPLQSCEV